MGKNTECAEKEFERKRTLLWKNKIMTSKETHRKFYDMAHFGQWDKHICSDCSSQKEPEFGKRFLPRMGKNKARSSEYDEYTSSRAIPRAKIPKGPRKM